jgi:hypothetical protein
MFLLKCKLILSWRWARRWQYLCADCCCPALWTFSRKLGEKWRITFILFFTYIILLKLICVLYKGALELWLQSIVNKKQVSQCSPSTFAPLFGGPRVTKRPNPPPQQQKSSWQINPKGYPSSIVSPTSEPENACCSCITVNQVDSPSASKRGTTLGSWRVLWKMRDQYAF